MGSHSQAEPGAAGGSKWAVGKYPGRERAIGALDLHELHERDGAGVEFAAGICATGAGIAHQAGDRGLLAAELYGEYSGVLRAVEFAEFVSALDGRLESHTVFVWLHAVGGEEYGGSWSGLVCAGGSDVSCGFALTESDWVDQCAAAAFGVDEFGDQRGAVLFPANAGRVGHQRGDVAGELSRLPVSRAQSVAIAGRLRAFDLGAVWI